MRKFIGCILIYLGLVLPVVLSAEPLKRYSVQPQQSESTAQPAPDVKNLVVRKGIYEEFAATIENYSPSEKDELEGKLRQKIHIGKAEDNEGKVFYYETLLSILKSDEQDERDEQDEQDE